MPWPLAACLEAAQSESDLELLAERLRSGALGSTKEWLNLEQTWLSNGLVFHELATMPEAGQFSLSFSWKHFSCSFNFESANVRDNLPSCASELAALYHSLDHNMERQTVGSILLSCLEAASSRFANISNCPDASLIRELLEVVDGHVQLGEMLLSLPIPTPLTSDWIELLDYVGLNFRIFYLSERFGNFPVVAALDESYRANPARAGLLTWLAALATDNPIQKIPLTYLELKVDDTPFVQFRKIVLRLAQGGVDNALAVHLAAVCAQLCKTEPSFWMLFSILDLSGREEWAEKFSIAFLNKFQPPESNRFYTRSIHALSNCLSQRRSSLHQADWKAKLGLEAILN